MVASGGVRGAISQIREAVITCSFRVDGSSLCVRRLAKGTPPTPRHAAPGTVIHLALLPCDTRGRLLQPPLPETYFLTLLSCLPLILCMSSCARLKQFATWVVIFVLRKYLTFHDAPFSTPHIKLPFFFIVKHVDFDQEKNFNRVGTACNETE